jgi:hypothetical protein
MVSQTKIDLLVLVAKRAVPLVHWIYSALVRAWQDVELRPYFAVLPMVLGVVVLVGLLAWQVVLAYNLVDLVYQVLLWVLMDSPQAV